MRYEYSFSAWYTDSLEEYLQRNDIKYKKEKWIPRDLLEFTIWSTDDNYLAILNDLRDRKVNVRHVSLDYSAADIRNAELLYLRVYKPVIEIVNGEEAYEYSCRWVSSMGVKKVNHKRQIGTFAIRKEPSSRTSTAFWREDTGGSSTFTDRRVYELAKAYSLQGIQFEKVMNKKGEFSENIFQIKSPNIITRDCIPLGHGERIDVCDICGREALVVDDTYQMHLDFSKLKASSDMYMTERIWGPGIEGSRYIISQRFYQLLKQNKLTGGIKVEPVKNSSV